MFAACGDDDDDSTDTAAPPETPADTSSGGTSSGGGSSVDISEVDFALEPSDPTAKAGTVTFNVTNDGQTTHALEVEGNGVEEETEDIAPGDSAELSVDLEAGSYEIYCPIDSHKDMGMEGELTVN
jgi:plastocyanin